MNASGIKLPVDQCFIAFTIDPTTADKEVIVYNNRVTQVLGADALHTSVVVSAPPQGTPVLKVAEDVLHFLKFCDGNRMRIQNEVSLWRQQPWGGPLTSGLITPHLVATASHSGEAGQ